MVRTKADGGGSRKVVASAAPRKALGGAGSSTDSSPAGKNKNAGGNPYCPRPTPEWQKGISAFLSPGKSKNKENTVPSEDTETAGSSKAGQDMEEVEDK